MVTPQGFSTDFEANQISNATSSLMSITTTVTHIFTLMSNYPIDYASLTRATGTLRHHTRMFRSYARNLRLSNTHARTMNLLRRRISEANLRNGISNSRDFGRMLSLSVPPRPNFSTSVRSISPGSTSYNTQQSSPSQQYTSGEETIPLDTPPSSPTPCSVCGHSCICFSQPTDQEVSSWWESQDSERPNGQDH